MTRTAARPDTLQFRPFEDADFPGVQRLWRDVAGWGELQRDVWEELLTHPDYGPGLTMVGTVGGDVVLHTGFLPSGVSVDGTPVAAARVYAVIVDRAIRSDVRDADHPFWRLYRAAEPELVASGFRMVYALANPRWRPGTGHDPFQRRPVAQWSVALPLAESPAPDPRLAIRPLAWDGSLDGLWERVSPGLGCAVVRNEHALKRRADRLGYTMVAAYREGELVGVAAGREKELDGWMSQWEIGEVLALDADACHAVIGAALAEGHAASVERGPRGAEQRDEKAIEKAVALTHPLLEDSLAGHGFAPDEWATPIIVHTLDPELEDAVRPERWYVSAND